MLTRRTFLFCASALAAVTTIGIPALYESGEAHADTLSPDAASAFIQQTGQDLVAIVNGSDNDTGKRAKLGTVIDRAVDVPGVAKFCLGSAWRTATTAQQDEFTKLFNQVIIVSIGGHLGDYKGVSFTMGRTVPTPAGVSVRTILNRPGNPPARVEWVVSNSTGSPKIVDVVAEGISLRLTQKADYASFLASNGDSVQRLIEALRKQVAGLG